MNHPRWLTLVLLGAAACGTTTSGGAPPDASVDAATDITTATDVTTVTDVTTITDGTTATDVIVTDVTANDGTIVTDAGTAVLPPSDIGELPIDGGALGAPRWAALDVRTTTSCPPLAACGGALPGTWDVSGGCFEVPVPAQLMMCPGARVTRSTGRARGRVTFGPLIADRAAQWEVEVELFIPSLCASFVGGCDGVQSAIRGAIPDSACVTEGGGNCRCAARQGGALRDGDGYASVGNQIVSASLMRRWDYCVEGARLRYRDVSATGAREPGTVELTRR
jgi:hypothetical protein